MSSLPSFLNWGFKPSINTDVFTEGGYKWGGDNKEFNLSLQFDMVDEFNQGYIPDENYNEPQGSWYRINVYLKIGGIKSGIILDTVLVSNIMIENWVDNNWTLSQAIINDWDEEEIENTDKIDIWWETDSYDSQGLKRLVFDNMDKVLIESRGDFPIRD